MARDAYTTEDYKEILRLLASGYSIRIVSSKYNLSPAGLHLKLKKLQEKLGLLSLAELLKYAKEKGLVNNVVCQYCKQEIK